MVSEDRLNRLHKELVKADYDHLSSDRPDTSCLRTILEGDVATIETETRSLEYLQRRYDGWKEAFVGWDRKVRKRAQKRREERIWLGIQDFYALLIPVAFAADKDLRIVRGRVIEPELGPGIFVFSVEADRSQAERAKGMASPEAAFEQFDCRPAAFARFTMQPVIPHGEGFQLTAGTSIGDLTSMSPTEFEHRIAAWLRGMGFAVTVTGGTGDEGIDLIAYSSEPITGGKYVVQCKRYMPGNDVGVREVRDLYGTLTGETANKGILITTSSFTAAAKRFAAGKPLELIDGLRLAQLLGTVGGGLDIPQQEYLTTHEDEEDLERGEAVPDSRDAIVEFAKGFYRAFFESDDVFGIWLQWLSSGECARAGTAKGWEITDAAHAKLERVHKQFLALDYPESSSAIRDSLLMVCRKRMEITNLLGGATSEDEVAESNRIFIESLTGLHELLPKFGISEADARKVIVDLGYAAQIKN
jgi:hypothetical protein